MSPMTKDVNIYTSTKASWLYVYSI